MTDAALTMCMSEIRKALGDDPRTPCYIETVHGLGYRFIALVSAEPVTLADSGFRVAEHASTTTRQSPSPHFVGREAEIEQLHKWLGRALKGERQIVFVTGEPGIGKTMLVEEFLQQAQIPSDGRLWLGRGQCIEHYGAGESYLPVLDALGRLCREPDGGRLVELLDKHAPAWLVQMPALLGPAEWKELQGRVAGVTSARMLRELADAMEVISAERPLVLRLEDLHWSDYSTVEWLGFLARRQEPARLLVLGTYRPVEVIVREHPLKNLKQELQIHGQCKELPLGLLGEAEVMEYLTLRFASPCSSEVSGGLQRSEPSARERRRILAHSIYQRTDGNPLFMVNVVDYIVQREIPNILGGAAAAQSAKALAADRIETPPSVVQMIEHNLERLNRDEQAMLEAASVAGAEFPVAAVAAMLEHPISEIEACFTRLSRQQQFIQSHGIGEWPDGTVAAQFQFLHGLYRDVLYERVPPGRRLVLHRRIAEREEEAYCDNLGEVAVELAYHYRLCANKTKTLKYLELAAERATARRAYHEAEQHYRDAIEALHTMPESPERLQHELSLLLALGSTMGATRGISAAETAEIYGRARALAKRAGSRDSIPLLWGLTLTAISQAELQTALALNREFLEIGRQNASATALFLAHNQYGSAYHFLGNLIAAREHFLEASKHYPEEEVRDLPFTPAILRLVMSGATEWRLGYPDRALSCLKEMLTTARRLNDPISICMAHYSAGQLYQLRGDWPRMLEAGDESLRLSTALQHPLLTSAAKIHLAYGRARTGELLGAADRIRDELSELAAMKWLVTRRMLLAWLTEVHLLTSEIAEARASLEQALQFNVEETLFQPELLRLRGELRLLGGYGDRDCVQLAEQDFRTAIDAARGMSAKSDELRATTSLARLLARRGRRDEAGTMLADVYGWFTEGFNTGDLRAAKLLLYELSQ